MKWKQIAVILATSWIVGCSQMPVYDSVDSTQEYATDTHEADATDVAIILKFEESLPPALKVLFKQADDALYAQNYPLALSRLERGQRIAPRSASVYYRLSVIRLKQNQPEEAEQLANKSLSFAQGNPDFQSQIWRLIAATRAQQGDFAGEQAAFRKAADL